MQKSNVMSRPSLTSILPFKNETYVYIRSLMNAYTKILQGAFEIKFRKSLPLRLSGVPICFAHGHMHDVSLVYSFESKIGGTWLDVNPTKNVAA